MSIRLTARVLAPVSLAALALGGAHAAPSVPMSALKKCADIISPADRLTCYDQLAERPATPVAAAPVALGAPAAPAAPAAPKESFGLYSAEHPATPPRAAAVTAKIISIQTGSSGRPIVTLEGDQMWELADSDPLLKSGDAVTIDRGVLGSFTMTTPAGRTHRLHRLR
jgi:hypothetical protein